MDKQVFSDGLAAITAVGGTVRLDLVSFSPTEKDAKGQPALVFQQRVIMSVEAFLLAADKMHEVAGALAKAGIRRPEAGQAERQNSPAAAEGMPVPAAAPGPRFP